MVRYFMSVCSYYHEPKASEITSEFSTMTSVICSTEKYTLERGQTFLKKKWPGGDL